MVAGNIEWLSFFTVIITLLLLDLGVLSRKNEPLSFKKSLLLSLGYIIISCLFGVFIYLKLGPTLSKQYFTGFLLEKAMSVDNIFVISMIFSFFKVPSKYQHRVLFWGILGVIILRAIMISAGVVLLANFSWVLYIFAIILIYTGIKMLANINHTHVDINELYVYQLLTKYCNVIHTIENENFFIRKQGKLFITPLFLALITIETMDLVFAIDSIPAIFAITQDPFIVYTSNIFAILGLRALFFCISHLVERFKYIKYSLSIILVLIGAKIFIAHFITIPAYIPLLITIALLTAGLVLSILLEGKNTKHV